MPYPLQVDCSAGTSCTIVIPASGSYRVDSFDEADAEPSPERLAARFLMQASFGPTRESVQNLTADAKQRMPDKIASWIEEQMQLPATLHREYWRLRASPRVWPSAFAGGIRSICEPGSRFHEFAFTQEDVSKVIEVALDEAAHVYSLSIEGTVRAEVSTFNVPESVAPYVVCTVEERVGGAVRLGRWCPTAATFPNPSIQFASPDPVLVRTVNSSAMTFVELSSLSGSNPEVLILSALHAPCSLESHGVRARAAP